MAKIVVVGAGIIGLWTAAEAASRGHHVTLYEKHTIGHSGGSSHGDTRIFRSAYWEGEEYVHLARRSVEKWAWLGKVNNQSLIEMTGTYYSGDSNSALICGVLNASSVHDLPISAVDSGTLFKNSKAKPVSLLEKFGGIIKADKSLRALAAYCRSMGVDIKEETEFLGEIASDAICIKCIGPWFADNQLLSNNVTSARVYCHWFEHDSSTPLFEKSFLLQGVDGRILYGMRTRQNEIKVGWHNYPIIPLAPGQSENSSPEIYVEDIRDALSSLTGAKLKHLGSKGCYFDNSSDENYIIDWSKPNELIVGGLSGHGFKFAPALAEGLIAAAESGSIPSVLSPFGLSRFRSGDAIGRTHLEGQAINPGKAWIF